MPIDIVPYTEAIVNPLNHGWRGWFQSVWNALRGWRETDRYVFTNPFSGTLCGAGAVTSVTTSPGVGLTTEDTLLIQPTYTTSIGTVILTATILSTGQIRWECHNYGGSSILSPGFGSIKVIVFRK